MNASWEISICHAVWLIVLKSYTWNGCSISKSHHTELHKNPGVTDVLDLYSLCLIVSNQSLLKLAFSLKLTYIGLLGCILNFVQIANWSLLDTDQQQH